MTIFMRLAPSRGARSRARRRSCAEPASPCTWAGRRALRPARSARAPGRERVARSVSSSTASAGNPPYLARRASSAARSPVATSRSRPSKSGSKSTSQIQDTSRPSAIASFKAMTASRGGPPATSVRTASLAPAGFLIRSTRSALVADLDALEAAESGAEALEPCLDLVQRRAERDRERGGRDRVVDVVEAGQPQADAASRLARDQIERHALQAVELDVAGGHVERGSLMPAVVAVVVAEVADVGSGVPVRPAAHETPLGVRGVREARGAVPGIVEAENDCARAAHAPDRRPGGRRRSPPEPWSPGARAPQSASAPRSAPARRSGRAGPETGSPGKPRAAGHVGRPRGRRLRPPRRGRAPRRSRRAAWRQLPETRLAPERLCARRVRGARISAVIAAVVVLPFVAEISAVPSGSRAASRSTALGSSIASSFPGTVVPPPAPTSLDSPAAARAAAIPATRGTRGRKRIPKCSVHGAGPTPRSRVA